MLSASRAILSYYRDFKTAHVSSLKAPFDRNRDGNIDPDRYEAYWQFKLTYRRERYAQVRTELAAHYDVNQDGLLDQAEMAWLWVPLIGNTVFNVGEWEILAMDTDRNNLIDEVESEVSMNMIRWMTKSGTMAPARAIRIIDLGATREQTRDSITF